MRNALSSAVFIDRDGTIMEDTDYCSDPKDVRIFPGVVEALRHLKSRGFKLIVITNQSGIGRGLFTLGLVCGATPIEAAEIANHGSAVVVSKLGTATVTRDELVASFREERKDA